MDLRKQRTYTMLTNAFLNLLSEKPFEDITVSELCDRAMIRRATFYKHFGDKYDFLAFLVRQKRAAVHEQVTAGGRPSTLQGYCTRMTHALVQIASESRPTLERLRLSTAFDAVARVASEEIAKDLNGFLKDHLGEGAPGPVFASFYASGLFGAVRWWLEQPDASAEELEAQLDAVIARLFA